MLKNNTYRKVRWSLYIVLGVIVIIEVYRVYPFLVADRYFDYQVSYGPYSIRSDKVIDDKMYEMMDEVTYRLSPFAATDTAKRYDIFLCHDQQLYGRFANIIGRSTQTQGLNVLPIQKIFINLTYIDIIREENENAKYQYNLLDGNPAHIIVHEIAHGWIQDELGYWKARRLNPWKSEGYCEFVATKKVKIEDSGYELGQSIRNLQSGYYNDISPELRIYIEGEMMVEKLMTEDGFSFRDLVDLKIDPQTILE